MGWEFLLLGLLSEGVRGYYSGKGKSGGGKFIGGKMGDDATKYDDLRKAAAGGDTDAQKQMEQMRDTANKERLADKQKLQELSQAAVRKWEEKQRSPADKKETAKQIPKGVRRVLYDEVYWDYVLQKYGKHRQSGGYDTEQQRRDSKAYSKFVPRIRPSASDGDKLKAYNERMKIIDRYKKDILPEVIEEAKRYNE